MLSILGFLVLPAAVVTIAAFNDKAMLSFPPQAWSLRWFARAIAYQDFREGFRNGLIVTAWSSTIALVGRRDVALSLSTATDFASRRRSKACCYHRSSSRILRSGLGFLILAAQIGMGAHLYVW